MKAKALIGQFKKDPNALLTELLAVLVSAKISLQDAKAIKQHLRTKITDINQELATPVDALLSSIAWYFENTQPLSAPPPAASAPAAVNLALPEKADDNIERIDRMDQLQTVLPIRTQSEPKLNADLYQIANAIQNKTERQARVDFLNQLDAKQYRPKKVGFFNPNPKWQANFNPRAIYNTNRFDLWQEHINDAVSRAAQNEAPDLMDIIRPFSGPVGSKSFFTFNKTALKVPLQDESHPLLDSWMKMVTSELTSDETLTAFMKYRFNQSLLHMGYNLAVRDIAPLLRILPLNEFIENYSQPEESHVVTLVNENTLRFTSRLALHDNAKRKILTVYSTIEVSKLSAQHSPHYEAKVTQLNVRAYSNRAKLIVPNAYNRYRMEKYLSALRIDKSRNAELSRDQVLAEARRAVRQALEPFADFLHPYKFKQILKLLIHEAQRAVQFNTPLIAAIDAKAKEFVSEHVRFFLKSNLPSDSWNGILDARLFKTDYQALENAYLGKLSLTEQIPMSEVARSVFSQGNWLAFDELNALIAEETLGKKNHNKSYDSRLKAHQAALIKKIEAAEKHVFRSLVRACSPYEKQQLNQLIDDFSKTAFFNNPFTTSVLKDLLLPQLAIQSILTERFKNKHGVKPEKAVEMARRLSVALLAGLDIRADHINEHALNKINNLLELLNQHGNVRTTIQNIADQFIAEIDPLETVVRKTLIRQLIAKTQASYHVYREKPPLRNLNSQEAKRTAAFRETLGAYLAKNPGNLEALVTNVNEALAKIQPIDLTVRNMTEACANAIAHHEELLLTQLIRDSLLPITVSDEAIANCRQILNTISFAPFRVTGWPANMASLKVIVNELYKNNLLSKPDLTTEEKQFLRKVVYTQALNDLLQIDLAEFKEQGGRRFNNALDQRYQQLVMVQLKNDPAVAAEIIKRMAETLALQAEEWTTFSQLRKELQSYIVNKQYDFTKHYRAETEALVDQAWPTQLPLNATQLALAKKVNLLSRMLFELSEVTLGANHAQTKAAKLLFSATQPEQVLNKLHDDSAEGFNHYLTERRTQLKQFLKSYPHMTKENSDLRTLALDGLDDIRRYQRQQKVDPLLPTVVRTLNPPTITWGRAFFGWLFRGFRFTNTENGESWYQRVNTELLAIREGGPLVNHILNLRNLIAIGRREAETRNIVAKRQLNNQLAALEKFIAKIDKHDAKKIKQGLIQNMLAQSPDQTEQNSLAVQKQKLQTTLSQHKLPLVQNLLTDNTTKEARLFSEANNQAKLEKATKAISKAIVAGRYTGPRNPQG